MVDRSDFLALVERAMATGGRAHMRPVIEKELLHYDILFALDRAGLLDELTFQGGTSLRLCHGAPRFSEDLDFAGGRGFSASDFHALRDCIEQYIGRRYGVEVAVKAPDEMAVSPGYEEIGVAVWQISVTTAPGRRDVPRQKIKLEVAAVPAHTREPRALQHNYDFLPDGYGDTLVMVESLDEMMADKLVSLVNCRRYVRHRDIWDLRWLRQKGAKINRDLLEAKVADYRIADYSKLVDEMIDRMGGIIRGSEFCDQMGRFIPAPVQERTLKKDKFLDFLVGEITDLLTQARRALDCDADDRFLM